MEGGGNGLPTANALLLADMVSGPGLGPATTQPRSTKANTVEETKLTTKSARGISALVS